MKNKKWVNRLLIIISAIIIGIMLFSIQHRKTDNVAFNNEKSQEPKKEIVIWGCFTEGDIGDGRSKAFFEMLRSIRYEYPDINIVYEGVEEQAYKKKIKIAMASNEMPDIFFSWGSSFIKPFIQAGKVLRLSEEDFEFSFFNEVDGEKALDEFKMNNVLFGVPYMKQVMLLYCNTDIFEKYHMCVPTTFEDLLEVSYQFRKKDIISIGIAGQEKTAALDLYNMILLRVAGHERYEEIVASGNFETEECIKATMYMNQLVDARAFSYDVLGTTSEEVEQLFLEGKIAMCFESSQFNSLVDVNIDSNRVKGNVMIVEFPTIEKGKGVQGEHLGGYSEGFCIYRDTKYPEEAKLILQRICEEMSNRCYKKGVGYPVWKLGKLPKDALISRLEPYNELFEGKLIYHTRLEYLLNTEQREEMYKKTTDVLSHMMGY